VRFLATAFCVVLVFFLLQQTQARIIHVPGGQSTIQEGINASASGDTVLVAPGTYYEHISFCGKAILLKSEDEPGNTIISEVTDGVPLVTFDSGEDTTSILEGFTIQGAKIFTLSNGAVRCQNSSCTIRNNILTRNGGDIGSEGAVVWLENSQANITNNQIKDNTHAIGILCFDNSCRISVSRNLILRNWVGIDSHGHDRIVYNTFSSHLRFNVELYGQAFVENNIMADGGVGIENRSGTLTEFSHNDVWGNVTNYNGCSAGENDMSTDPIFCDPENDDYRLNPSSPCLSAGQGGSDVGALGSGCAELKAKPKRHSQLPGHGDISG
jgi:hypothetical protein